MSEAFDNTFDSRKTLLWDRSKVLNPVSVEFNSKNLKNIWLDIKIWKSLSGHKEKELVLEGECAVDLDEILMNSNSLMGVKRDLFILNENIGFIDLFMDVDSDYLHINKPLGVMNDEAISVTPRRKLSFFEPSSKNEELVTLQKLKFSLKELLIKKSKNWTFDFDMKAFTTEIFPILDQLLHCIASSCKAETNFMFNYKNTAEIEMGQQDLIEILKLLVDHFTDFDHRIEIIAINLIINILRRGELMLDHMSAVENQTWTSQKLERAIMYQYCHYRLLKNSILKINKVLKDEEKELYDLVMVLSYLRVKPFRKALLNMAGVKLSSEERDRSSDAFSSTYRAAWSWDEYFFNFLKFDPRAAGNEEILEEALAPLARNMKPNDSLILKFISDLFKHVKEYQNIPPERFSEVIGYQVWRDQLIYYFLAGESSANPELILNLISVMIHDTKDFLLINQKLDDLIKDPKKFDFVFSIKMSFLSQWCLKTWNIQKQIPFQFNSDNLFEYLDRFHQEGDVAKLQLVLIFVFNFFHIFPLNLRMQTLDIFSEMHFDLMTHWCSFVRKLIQLLFVYRFISMFEERGEADFQIKSLLEKINAVSVFGKEYKNALFVWERKSAVQKRKFPLSKLKESILEQETQTLLLFNPRESIFSFLFVEEKSLKMNRRRSSTRNTGLGSENLPYCHTASEEFNTILKGYIVSKYRRTRDPLDLPQVLDRRFVDKSEIDG